MASNNVTSGDYLFREGTQGDRKVGNFVDPKNRPPNFVLEYRDNQVGAAHGGKCSIMFFQIFEPGKGHGTKFIELWEQFSRNINCNEIHVDAITSARASIVLAYIHAK